MGACVSCGEEPAVHERSCALCQSDVGFPNVRLARQGRERSALAKRLRGQNAKGNDAEYFSRRRMLRDTIRAAEVVFNRRLGTLHTWLSSDNPQFLSFYGQVHSGRRPKDDQWERQRGSVENLIHPLFYEKISVAALAPAGRGLDYYGPYTIRLNQRFLQHRATVFETNPFHFCEQQKLVAGQDPPPGFRATWRSRESLALAKLGQKLSATMSQAEVDDLVMEQRGNSADCDFIEVHIYGPVHRASIEEVRGPAPSDPGEAVIWRECKQRLLQAGVRVVESG